MRGMNKTKLSLFTAVLLATTGSQVLAADMDGAKLFADKTCATCHGKDGNTPIMAGYPAIGGQSAEYILQQMKDIKAGTRKNGQSEAMRVVMQLVSDEEIATLATYVSTLEYKPGLAVSKLEKKDAAPAAAPAAEAKPADSMEEQLKKIAAAGKTDTPAAAPVSAAMPAAAATPSAAPATGEKPAAAMTGKSGEGKNVWMAEGSEREAVMDLKPDLKNGLEVYEVCSGCHLGEGWGKPDGTFPQLSGQHKEVLIKQLADIRAKNRDNPTMYPFALPEAIGDEQALADVVGYIESLPMNPDNGKGEWAEGTPEFTKGKQLYADNCVKCHGEDGMGKADKFYPRIDGQHYNYMLRQFEWIRDGKRRNANPEMVDQIKVFTDMDMKMVVNYASRLPVPKDDVAPSKDWKNPDFE